MAEEEAAELLQLNLKVIHREKLSIEVSSDVLVSDLKKRIADLLQQQQETEETDSQLRLIYQGKVLKNDQSLRHYQIQTGHTLHVVLRPNHSTTTTETSPPSPPPVSNPTGGMVVGQIEVEATTSEGRVSVQQAPLTGENISSLIHNMLSGMGVSLPTTQSPSPEQEPQQTNDTDSPSSPPQQQQPVDIGALFRRFNQDFLASREILPPTLDFLATTLPSRGIPDSTGDSNSLRDSEELLLNLAGASSDLNSMSFVTQQNLLTLSTLMYREHLLVSSSHREEAQRFLASLRNYLPSVAQLFTDLAEILQQINLGDEPGRATAQPNTNPGVPTINGRPIRGIMQIMTSVGQAIPTVINASTGNATNNTSNVDGVSEALGVVQNLFSGNSTRNDPIVIENEPLHSIIQVIAKTIHENKTDEDSIFTNVICEKAITNLKAHFDQTLFNQMNAGDEEKRTRLIREWAKKAASQFESYARLCSTHDESILNDSMLTSVENIFGTFIEVIYTETDKIHVLKRLSERLVMFQLMELIAKGDRSHLAAEISSVFQNLLNDWEDKHKELSEIRTNFFNPYVVSVVYNQIQSLKHVVD